MKNDKFKSMKKKDLHEALNITFILSGVVATFLTLAIFIFVKLLSYFFNDYISINDMAGFLSIIYLFSFNMLLALITPAIFMHIHMNDEQFHDDQGGGE